MPYPESFIGPMREELTRLEVQELRTPDEVDAVVRQKSATVMVVVNSMCGCAASKARPGVALALRHSVTPDVVATVFASRTRLPRRSRTTLRRRSIGSAPLPRSGCKRSPYVVLKLRQDHDIYGGESTEFSPRYCGRDRLRGEVPTETLRRSARYVPDLAIRPRWPRAVPVDAITAGTRR